MKVITTVTPIRIGMARRMLPVARLLALSFICACLWPCTTRADDMLTLSYQVNCHYVTPLSTAKLVCALETDSDSNTDVSWTHNGVLVEPGSATSITHNHVHITGTRKTNLNIVSAGYSDAGIYLAHVKGVGVSIIACNITLEMRQKPSDCPSQTFTNAKIEIARTVKQDQTTVEGDVACIYSGQSLLTQQRLSRPYNVTYHYFNGTGLIGQDTQGIHGLNTNKLCVVNTNMRSITGVVVNSSNDCASSACLRVSITETSLTWRQQSHIVSVTDNTTIAIGKSVVYACNATGYAPILNVYSMSGVILATSTVIPSCAIANSGALRIQGSYNHYNTVLADGSVVSVFRNCSSAAIRIHTTVHRTGLGTITCTARSDGGNRTSGRAVTRITPSVYPTVSILADFTTCSTTHLRCRAYGYPVPTTRWLYQGEMLPANASRGGTLEVDQHGVGNYTCIGVSKHGVAVTSILFNGSQCPIDDNHDSNSILSMVGGIVGGLLFLVLLLILVLIRRKYCGRPEKQGSDAEKATETSAINNTSSTQRHRRMSVSSVNRASSLDTNGLDQSNSRECLDTRSDDSSTDEDERIMGGPVRMLEQLSRQTTEPRTTEQQIPQAPQCLSPARSPNTSE